MIVKGEVKCYHCGFVSGELIAETKVGLRAGTFRPVGACAQQSPQKGRIRCCRCGGPVYLEDVTQLRSARTTTHTVADSEVLIERTAES